MAKYHMVKHLCTLSETEVNGEKRIKEACLISWNGAAPVIDLRAWNADHTECSSGFTMTESEAITLIKALKEFTNRQGE